MKVLHIFWWCMFGSSSLEQSAESPALVLFNHTLLLIRKASEVGLSLQFTLLLLSHSSLVGRN